MQLMRLDEWAKYRDILKQLSAQAADEFRDAVWNLSGKWGGVGLGKIPREEIIAFAHALATKYGEAAAALACQMFDEIAAAEGANIAPAIPAETATMEEVAIALNGTIPTDNPEIISGSIGRLVKLAGEDTTLKNAMRAGFECAWIPHGDTCAFCITLASRGWQPVTKKSLKNGHAVHIHANCDCSHAVRRNSNSTIEGYDPEKYKDMYYSADPYGTPKDRINAMRRAFYKDNGEYINEQKRFNYAKQKERESSRAEEMNVGAT